VAQRTRAFVAAAIGLALLTFVILGSAAFRLSLYQDAYGWTELRFYIDATIAWLGLGIVSAVVLLLRDRMRWLVHAMTIAAVVILVGVNVIGAQRHVAEANVARLLDPALVPPDGRKGLDVSYLMLDLEARWRDLNRPEATAWPAWNLAHERARAALAPLFAP
jgi:two-component system sensor histidine kinase BaeS